MQLFKTNYTELRHENIYNIKGSYNYVQLKISLCQWYLKHDWKQIPSIRDIAFMTMIKKSSISRHLLRLEDETFLKSIGEGTGKKYFMQISKDEAIGFLDFYSYYQSQKKKKSLIRGINGTA
jgi:DNA-binding transcriptional regulator YhcF (GntR family)